MNIFVSNLTFGISADNLQALFAHYGTVNSSKIITDKITNRSRGFGFIEMPDEKAAAKAIYDLNGTMQDGRPMKVVESRPKDDRSSDSRRW